MTHIEASSTFFPSWVRASVNLSLAEADVIRALEGMLKGEQYRRDGNTIRVFPKTQMFVGGSYQAMYREIAVTVIAVNDQYSRIEYQFVPRSRGLRIAAGVMLILMSMVLFSMAALLMSEDIELGLLVMSVPLVILIASGMMIFVGNRKGSYHRQFEKTFLRQLTRYGLIIKEKRTQV